MDTTEPLGTLYIRFQGQQYRFKVWGDVLRIESQPGGENIALSRNDEPDADTAYDYGVWNFDALARLVHRYEHGLLT